MKERQQNLGKTRALQAIKDYGPAVIKILATSAVLFETSMMMGKVRIGICPHRKDPKLPQDPNLPPPCEPFQHEPGTAGRHGTLNDKARALTHVDKRPRGILWKRRHRAGTN